jgi:hypothetical protein
LPFHEVIRDSDPARIFSEEGSMKALLAAKKQGEDPYVGFTGVRIFI